MAAEAQGIATIAQASIAEMSDIVRETLGIPEDRDVLARFHLVIQTPRIPPINSEPNAHHWMRCYSSLKT